MLIERRSIKSIDRAAYNPRVELRPGDDEYEALLASMDTYGCVVPLILNQRTNRLVGGHQRLTVLENKGETEADFSIVDLDEISEKKLNIALNKVQGTWDDGKLETLLTTLGDRALETGFSQQEIDALESRIEDMLDNDFIDSELSQIEETFNLTLDFPAERREAINDWIRENGKDALVTLMIETANGGET